MAPRPEAIPTPVGGLSPTRSLPLGANSNSYHAYRKASASASAMSPTQTYGEYLTAAAAADRASHRASSPIAPSVISALSVSGKRSLRRYRRIWWITLGLSQIMLVNATCAAVFSFQALARGTGIQLFYLIWMLISFATLALDAAIVLKILVARRSRHASEKKWCWLEMQKWKRALREKTREAERGKMHARRLRSSLRSVSRAVERDGLPTTHRDRSVSRGRRKGKEVETLRLTGCEQAVGTLGEYDTAVPIKATLNTPTGFDADTLKARTQSTLPEHESNMLPFKPIGHEPGLQKPLPSIPTAEKAHWLSLLPSNSSRQFSASPLLHRSTLSSLSTLSSGNSRVASAPVATSQAYSPTSAPDNPRARVHRDRPIELKRYANSGAPSQDIKHDIGQSGGRPQRAPESHHQHELTDPYYLNRDLDENAHEGRLRDHTRDQVENEAAPLSPYMNDSAAQSNENFVQNQIVPSDIGSITHSERQRRKMTSTAKIDPWMKGKGSVRHREVSSEGVGRQLDTHREDERRGIRDPRDPSWGIDEARMEFVEWAAENRSRTMGGTPRTRDGNSPQPSSKGPATKRKRRGM